jgi:hypothetical protein
VLVVVLVEAGAEEVDLWRLKRRPGLIAKQRATAKARIVLVEMV